MLKKGIDNPIYGMPSPNNTRIPISAPLPQDGAPHNTNQNSTGGPPSPNLHLNAHNVIPKQINKNINELGKTFYCNFPLLRNIRQRINFNNKPKF